jgi:hypothetical protein
LDAPLEEERWVGEDDEGGEVEDMVVDMLHVDRF